MFMLKKIVVFIQLLVLLVTNRPFGAVIFDISNKYDGLDLTVLGPFYYHLWNHLSIPFTFVHQWFWISMANSNGLKYLSQHRIFTIHPGYIHLEFWHDTTVSIHHVLVSSTCVFFKPNVINVLWAFLWSYSCKTPGMHQ